MAISQGLANISEDEAKAIIATTTPWLTFSFLDYHQHDTDTAVRSRNLPRQSIITFELIHGTHPDLRPKNPYGAIGEGRPLPKSYVEGHLKTWTPKRNGMPQYVPAYEDHGMGMYDEQAFLAETECSDFEYRGAVYDDQGLLIEKENALPVGYRKAADVKIDSKVRAFQPSKAAIPLPRPQQPSPTAPIPLPHADRDNHSLGKNVLRNNAASKRKVLETIPEVEAEHKDISGASAPSSPTSTSSSNETQCSTSPNSSFSSSSSPIHITTTDTTSRKPLYPGLIPGTWSTTPIKVLHHRQAPPIDVLPYDQASMPTLRFRPSPRPSRTVRRELQRLQSKPGSVQALIDARVTQVAGLSGRACIAMASVNVDTRVKNVAPEEQEPMLSAQFGVEKWSTVASAASVI